MSVPATLIGTGGLVRLILRRDRVLLPVWIAAGVLIPVNFAAATDAVYPTAADRLEYARSTGTNPTYVALYGRLYDDSLGAIVTQRAGLILVLMGLISALVVVRHTRTEEEAGRRELLGATVLGRDAGLAAALLVAMGANLIIAALLTAGMASQDLPVGGSLAFGLQMALAGCAFAAVAGVAAQLSESAGAARGMAIAVLGAAFLIRMSSDTGDTNSLSWLGWFSPLGWCERLRPYAQEEWWVTGLFATLVAVLVAVAAALSERRDLGAGILPPRPGPADAGPWLNGTLGLAWRLHSRPLYGWTAGLAALAIAYGGFADGIQQMVDDNEQVREIFERLSGGRDIVDAYFTTAIGVLGVIAAAYAVSAVLRARSEETSLHAEALLCTATGRLRWVLSHLAFAVLGSAVAMAVSGLLAGLVHGLNADDIGHWVPRVLGAAVAQLPAVWLIAAITLALFGLLPRLSALGWGALAVAGLITLFGVVLDLDQWALDVSPFTHIPDLPGGDLALAPLAWLAGLSVLLIGAGLAGFRRRDVPVG